VERGTATKYNYTRISNREWNISGALIFIYDKCKSTAANRNTQQV